MLGTSSLFLFKFAASAAAAARAAMMAGAMESGIPGIAEIFYFQKQFVRILYYHLSSDQNCNTVTKLKRTEKLAVELAATRKTSVIRPFDWISLSRYCKNLCCFSNHKV